MNEEKNGKNAAGAPQELKTIKILLKVLIITTAATAGIGAMLLTNMSSSYKYDKILLDQYNKMTSNGAFTLDDYGNRYDKEGNMVDEEGNVINVDEDGNPIDADGNLIDENGEVIEVDENGDPIGDDEIYLDESGAEVETSEEAPPEDAPADTETTTEAAAR
jgi:hypothetical protein